MRSLQAELKTEYSFSFSVRLLRYFQAYDTNNNRRIEILLINCEYDDSNKSENDFECGKCLTITYKDNPLLM